MTDSSFPLFPSRRHDADPARTKLQPGQGVDGSPFTREEVERSRLQRTGRPLVDVLKDLEKLA